MTVVRRYEFGDRYWAEIELLLPKQERGGKWNDHRTVMNGMFWVLRSGSAWRDVPEGCHIGLSHCGNRPTSPRDR
ncbi:MAG: transposase [Myxococcales bacterium]|nr:transposase [Myxococcales bacterium]